MDRLKDWLMDLICEFPVAGPTGSPCIVIVQEKVPLQKIFWVDLSSGHYFEKNYIIAAI